MLTPATIKSCCWPLRLLISAANSDLYSEITNKFVSWYSKTPTSQKRRSFHRVWALDCSERVIYWVFVSVSRQFGQRIKSSPFVTSHELQGGAGDLFYPGPHGSTTGNPQPVHHTLLISDQGFVICPVARTWLDIPHCVEQSRGSQSGQYRVVENYILRRMGSHPGLKGPLSCV